MLKLIVNLDTDLNLDIGEEMILKYAAMISSDFALKPDDVLSPASKGEVSLFALTMYFSTVSHTSL